MTGKTGKPATTTSTAMIAALRAIGAQRVALASPYMPDVERALIAFLAEHDIEAVSSVALNLPVDHSIVDQADILGAARGADRDAADAVFISCTGQRLNAYLDGIAASLGKPVLAANQVTAWHALTLGGWADQWPGPATNCGKPPPRRRAIGWARQRGDRLGSYRGGLAEQSTEPVLGSQRTGQPQRLPRVTWLAVSTVLPTAASRSSRNPPCGAPCRAAGRLRRRARRRPVRDRYPVAATPPTSTPVMMPSAPRLTVSTPRSASSRWNSAAMSSG